MKRRRGVAKTAEEKWIEKQFSKIASMIKKSPQAIYHWPRQKNIYVVGEAKRKGKVR